MQYLTIKQYATLLGVSRQAIEDRIKRGTLIPVEVRVKVKRIPVEDIELAQVK